MDRARINSEQMVRILKKLIGQFISYMKVDLPGRWEFSELYSSQSCFLKFLTLRSSCHCWWTRRHW